jgi:cerevisin
MRSHFTVTGLLAAWTAVVAAAPQVRRGEGFISAQHNAEHNATDARETIVFIAKDASCESVVGRMDNLDETAIKKTLATDQYKACIINAPPHCREGLMAMDEVDDLEERMEIQAFGQKTLTTWGLQRISNDAGASGDPESQDFIYSFDDDQLGAGVDVYIVDTGIHTKHPVFSGRITEGFGANGSFEDDNGHGTHVSGTAAGTKFGVAQNANIIAVKVLGADGGGSTSDTVEGMTFAINRHNERKNQPGFKGSVMNMSWGFQQGTFSTAVDRVVRAASDAGIHVAIAAGNDGGQDSCNATPSRNGGADSAIVTVGAVNIDNELAFFSNIGPCVDIYAPGQDILSSFINKGDPLNGGDLIVQFLNGTSMATPHVTGVMAYLLAQDTSGKLAQDPAALKATLLKTARQGAFTGNIGGSANLLLSNGVDGRVSATPKRVRRNWAVSRNNAIGSPASRARNAVDDLDTEFQLYSEKAKLQY